MNFGQNKSTKAPFKNRRLRPCHIDYTDERLWEPSYLRAKCKELSLEEEYQRYQIRLMISNLSVFYVLLIFLSLSFLAVELIFVERIEGMYVDIMSRQLSFVVVMILLSVNFCENFVNRHRWVMVFSSALSAYIVLIGDLAHNTYHYYAGGWQLNAQFDVFVLCMIYMFMPIPSIRGAALLATSVSLTYITFFLTYLLSVKAPSVGSYDDISVDILHNLGFNMMGIFFRVMNETMVRASFLDRHQFIMEEKWLRHALLQESMLLDSILPPQIAKPIQDSIKNKIKQNENEFDRFGSGGSWRRETFMAIQIHPDVSILYADLVNYTHLTTTLTVENLVKVLHDLYGRFDMAASTFNVQRIKFLGDCYYCVAGLTTPDPDHAKCAVSLGISMIANIQEVRAERKLDIDMRIGVHSGSLLAGVIGEAKLQYDIWGADVEIANRLESTGRPGFVHVSGRTLSNLNPSDYTIMSGTEAAQSDPLLESMSTYLLTDHVYRNSVGSTIEGVLSATSLDIKPVESVRMHPPARLSMTKELHEEFQNMPVGGFDFHSPCCRRASNEKTKREVGLFCAAFKDKSLEWNYLHQPDFILKSSVLLAWGIGCCLIYIQVVTVTFACTVCIVVDLIAFLFLTSLLCIAWYKKFCWWKTGGNEFKWHSKYSCTVFHLFEKIQHSATMRICVYFLIIISYYSVISLIMINCDRDLFELSYIESKLFHYEMDPDICFHPWSFTNMISLILGISYTFARIPFALKIFVSGCEAIAFMLIVVFQFSFNFQHSATTIPFMRAEVAHCLRVCMMLATMYAKERHSEFNTKINYKLNVDLQSKQKAADVTNQSIIILLNNILPSHVVLFRSRPLSPFVSETQTLL
ncbi:adenylyl cyclase X E-like isoform X4 [Drosophila biarmipes]|uniref:adenylyl cyclase X E-like isoform X4 n=1 Tax=Drosophila biarmipes TaxID=125945 RepID=UPI0007E6955F|nr:adenylyl cyclase X E-like isoform X4 [Drosophila biarmipes]